MGDDAFDINIPVGSWAPQLNENESTGSGDVSIQLCTSNTDHTYGGGSNLMVTMLFSRSIKKRACGFKTSAVG